MKIDIQSPVFRAEAAAIDELIENVRRCSRMLMYDDVEDGLVQSRRQLREAKKTLRAFCTPTREIEIVNGRIFL